MTGLADAVRAFVERTVRPQVEAWDRADDLPDAVIRELVGLGVTGALVPRAHGGGGLGVADLAPVWRELSRGWISLTGAINPTGLATALLVRHGTEAQRERWLPGIALDVGRVNVACRGLGILDRCLACALEESGTREVGGGLLGEHTHAQVRIGGRQRRAADRPRPPAAGGHGA